MAIYLLFARRTSLYLFGSGSARLGDQEDLVEDKLLECCADYKEIARTYRKSKDDRRGPSEVETAAAVDALQTELLSPELADIVLIDPILPTSMVEQVVNSVTEYVTSRFQAKFDAKVGNLQVRMYLEEDLSSNDPYVTVEATRPNEVIIIVNKAHPHWNQLYGAQGVLNYLRHCAYDGIAEWQARMKTSRIDPHTIKLLKDSLLRVPLLIEAHQD